jgi:iron complex transport system substrate-binding protein
MRPNAELVVQRMKMKMNEIKKLTENAKKVRVYAEEWHKPPFVCGNWIPELIDLAGGESLISGGRSREVSLEEIQKFDPHYMIITWCGFGEKAQSDLVKYREGWENVYAVKNNRVLVFDDSYLNRPGPRIVDGLEMLAKTIHPELFK